MTLKQKFFNIYTSYYKKSNELDKMVEVADNYAIDFAEWVYEYNKTGFTTDELLIIFKKEKGL